MKFSQYVVRPFRMPNAHLQLSLMALHTVVSGHASRFVHTREVTQGKKGMHRCRLYCGVRVMKPLIGGSGKTDRNDQK